VFRSRTYSTVEQLALICQPAAVVVLACTVTHQDELLVASMGARDDAVLVVLDTVRASRHPQLLLPLVRKTTAIVTAAHTACRVLMPRERERERMDRRAAAVSMCATPFIPWCPSRLPVLHSHAVPTLRL
jgi:hypothetical protein